MPDGPLSREVQSTMISAANKEVKEAIASCTTLAADPSMCLQYFQVVHKKGQLCQTMQ